MPDEPYQTGRMTELSIEIDKNKRGLWPAIEDFLARHPEEWVLQERRFHNHGFAILKRISNFKK